MAAKRQAAPAGRQGNDGWRSVAYEGAPLEKYRKQYAAQFDAPADDDEVDRLPLAAAFPSLVRINPADCPMHDRMSNVWPQEKACLTKE